MSPVEQKEVYYSYGYRRIYDLYDYSNAESVAMVLNTHEVLRRTARGAWVRDEYHKRERFVLDDARKRFAYPTKEDALNSFLIRKHRQVDILKRQIARIEAAIQLATEMEATGKLDCGDGRARVPIVDWSF